MTRARLAFAACIAAVALGALALRLPRLGLRPMHGDEGNQAVKTADLLESGRYRYDPVDHHGPTLYYATLPVLWLAGIETRADVTEAMLCLVPALFGVGAVLVVALLADGLGRVAAACAAALAALSPAMVFYSRYFVQETLLVFFTLGLVAAGWRYARRPSWGWAIAAGAMLGLMHATKETWVLAGASMLVAALLAWVWGRRLDRREAPPAAAPKPRLRGSHLAAALAVAAAVAGVLFSSFFTHARGPLDSVLTFVYQATRAGGTGLHDHPPHYYLAMLACSRLVTGFRTGPWWSEGLILALALVGVVAALARRGLADVHAGLARFLALYTLALAAAYAVIPYKTPWCVLSVLAGMTLLAGLGAAALVRWTPTRPLKALLALGLAALAAHVGWQAYRASFVFPVDQRNPYVYAHTSPDALNLVRRIEEAAAVSPQGRDMVIKIITPENYWPLPWYLRRFNQDHVGWYHQVPPDPDAAVIVTSDDCRAAVDERLAGVYNTQSLFGLRPGVVLRVYVEEGLWEALVEKWSAPRAPGQGAPP